jgi:hypothetical protein
MMLTTLCALQRTLETILGHQIVALCMAIRCGVPKILNLKNLIPKCMETRTRIKLHQTMQFLIMPLLRRIKKLRGLDVWNV